MSSSPIGPGHPFVCEPIQWLGDGSPLPIRGSVCREPLWVYRVACKHKKRSDLCRYWRCGFMLK